MNKMWSSYKNDLKKIIDLEQDVNLNDTDSIKAIRAEARKKGMKLRRTVIDGENFFCATTKDGKSVGRLQKIGDHIRDFRKRELSF